MPKIKDERYASFRAGKRFNYLTEDDLKGWLKTMEYPKAINEARAFLILLYYTGRRPSEILNMMGKDVVKDVTMNGFWITFETKKGGRISELYFPLKIKELKEVFNFTQRTFTGAYLFYHLRGTGSKLVTWKSKKTGEVKSKVYIANSQKVWMWVKRWTGITPYYFRHNRLSKEASNPKRTIPQLMELKGAKDPRSLAPYLRPSQKEIQEMGEKLE